MKISSTTLSDMKPSGQTYEVRQMTEHDIKVVSQIVSNEIKHLGYDNLASRLMVALELSKNTCFVAESEQQVIGAIVAMHNGFHIFVSHIAVRKSWQRKGVGSLLHEALFQKAQELKVLGIIADSWLTATGFFHKLGYRLPGAVFMINDVSEKTCL